VTSVKRARARQRRRARRGRRLDFGLVNGAPLRAVRPRYRRAPASATAPDDPDRTAERDPIGGRSHRRIVGLPSAEEGGGCSSAAVWRRSTPPASGWAERQGSAPRAAKVVDHDSSARDWRRDWQTVQGDRGGRGRCRPACSVCRARVSAPRALVPSSVWIRARL